MKYLMTRHRSSTLRLAPIARAVASACLGLTANAAMAVACSVSVSALNDPPCDLLTGDSVTIESTGSIVAPTDVNGDGLTAITAVGNALDVTNDGLILGAAGIRVGSGGSVGTITNDGEITGIGGTAIDLTGASGATTITNTGSINGAVLLGGGTLNLNGTTGSINGAVSGGAGSSVDVNGSYSSGGNYDVGSFTIESTGTFDLEHTLTLGNALTNFGMLNLNAGSSVAGAITGTGDISVNADFTTQGSVSAGLLSIASGGTLNAGYAITVANALNNLGILNLNVGASVGGDISGTGDINVNTDFTTQGGVSAGLLSIASGKTLDVGHTITVSNALSNAGTLNLNTGATVSGAITGNGALNVNTDFFTEGNVSAGLLSIAAGKILDAGHAITVSSSLSNAGTLNLNAGSSVAGAITGTGDINVNTDFTTQGSVSAGLLSIAPGTSLSAAHSLTASDAIDNGGILNLNTGSSVVAVITGAGTLNVNTDFTTQGDVSAGLLSVAPGKVLNIANAITVSDALNNAGTLNLNTGATVTGVITGNGGLNINTDFTTEDSVTAGLIALATGRTLNVQHAVVASAGLTNAGTLNIAAGNTVTAGSYSQSAGGVLRVGASSAINHGTLVVSGNANFSASGAIDVNVSQGDTFVNNDVMHVVTAGTLTSPASYSVTDNSALWNFTAADNGTNGIDLTAHFGSLTSAIQAASQPAAAGVAEALNSILSGTVPTSMQTLAAGLNSQTSLVSLGNQVAQLTPVLSGAQGVAALASINAGASSLVQNQVATTLGLASGSVALAQNVWVKPFGANLNQNATSSGIPGYKAATSGLAVGADGKLGYYAWRGGAALSYGTTKVEDAGANQGALDVTSWQVTAYGTHRINDSTQVNLMGGIGYNNNKSSRYVPLVAATYVGQYNSWHALLDAELEWARKLSESTSVIPSVRLSYSSLHSDPYTETPSGNAALNVASGTTDSLMLGFGAKFVRKQGTHGRWIAHTDAGFDLADKRSALASTFEGGGPSFNTSGATPSGTLLKAGLAYQQTFANGSEMTARFDTESRDSFTGNSMSLNLRFAF